MREIILMNSRVQLRLKPIDIKVRPQKANQKVVGNVYKFLKIWPNIVSTIVYYKLEILLCIRAQSVDIIIFG